jgi:hypothetical protein
VTAAVAVLALSVLGCSEGTTYGDGTVQSAATTSSVSSGSPAPTSPAAAGAEFELPEAIECHTYYRPQGERSNEGAQERSLRVERRDGLVDGERGEGTLEFPTMVLDVSYIGEARMGRVVGDAPDLMPGEVYVTVTTDAGERLVHTLYQVRSVSLDDIDFGGFGFTGLQYVSQATRSSRCGARRPRDRRIEWV